MPHGMWHQAEDEGSKQESNPLAEIHVQTEEKRRLSQVARAETAAQVLVRKSQAEVGRQKLLAQQASEKQRIPGCSGTSTRVLLAAWDTRSQGSKERP